MLLTCGLTFKIAVIVEWLDKGIIPFIDGMKPSDKASHSFLYVRDWQNPDTIKEILVFCFVLFWILDRCDQRYRIVISIKLIKEQTWNNNKRQEIVLLVNNQKQMVYYCCVVNSNFLALTSEHFRFLGCSSSSLGSLLLAGLWICPLVCDRSWANLAFLWEILVLHPHKPHLSLKSKLVFPPTMKLWQATLKRIIAAFAYCAHYLHDGHYSKTFRSFLNLLTNPLGRND